jgi:PAS domain S-box-containing protein
MNADHMHLFDQFALALVVADAQSLRVLEMNAAACRLSGYSAAEANQLQLGQLFPHMDAAELIYQLAGCSEAPGFSRQVAGRLFALKDGSRRTVDIQLRSTQAGPVAAVAVLVQDATGRQLAQDQLHYVLRATQLGCWDWNIAQGSFDVDERWLDIYGCRRDALPQLPEAALALLHPEDSHWVRERFLEHILYEDNFTLDFRARHTNGQTIWVRCAAAVVSRDLRSGNPLRVCGTAQDITQQKQADLEREQFHKFFRLSYDLMMIGRPDGRLVRVNPAMVSALGYSEEELLGMPLMDLIHPDDLNASMEEHSRQVNTGSTIDFENRCLCKDGSYRWLSWRVRYNADENLSYASARDITSQKAAQEELRKQQELHASLLNNTEDVICHFDRAQRHTYVNPAIASIWDVAPADYIGRTRREMGFPEEMCRIWEESLEYVFTTGRPHRDISTYESPRGSARVYWYAFPGLIEARKVKTVFTVSRDITDYARTEEELRKMQKLNSLGILAGGIAHDFNNILTVLFGNIALARSYLPEDHKSHSSLDLAEQAFHRATHLTSQLLTFAKGGDPVKQDVSITAFIEEVVKFDLSGSKVKLVFNAAADLWKARVDKGQIAQVFSNLATNANQAMPYGGHLYVRLDNRTLQPNSVPGLAAGDYLCCTVRDEGTGIAATDIDKIFDPYFSTRQEGSGLGLATVYSIVSKHGGNISVVSRPGQGATFTLYLPASNGVEQPDPQAAIKGTSKARGNSRILIMDDEKMICELAATFLTNKGYVVESAYDGKQAIALYAAALQRGEPYDCLLMDLTIPGGMSGKDALTEILKLDPEARAIVSSGYAADPVMANFEAHGFKGCISKPFFIAALLAEIRRVLGDTPG